MKIRSSILLLAFALIFAVSGIATQLLAQQTQAETSKPTRPEELGHVGHLDFQNGFRGIKFGTAASAMSGVQLSSNVGGLSKGARKDENLKLGPVQLTKIAYRFVDDNFYAVELYAAGGDNIKLLRGILETAYGPGATPPPPAPVPASTPGTTAPPPAPPPDALTTITTFWEGGTARALLAVDLKLGEAQVVISNLALSASAEKKLADSLKQAAKEL